MAPEMVLGDDISCTGDVSRDKCGEVKFMALQVQRKWPGYLRRKMLPPSYETDDMVLPRVFMALESIRKNHAGESVAIVCHAGVIHAVEAYLKAQAGYRNPRRVRIGNLGARWIRWDGVAFRLGRRLSLLITEGEALSVPPKLRDSGKSRS